MGVMQQARTVFWTGVVIVAAITAISIFPDDPDDDDDKPDKASEPFYGPSKPGFDKKKNCWRLSFEIEGVASYRKDPDRPDSFRVDYEATLGSAGVSGGSNIKIIDGLKYPNARPWKKDFCARPGDWLHGDVTISKGQAPVASISCYFGMGPQQPEDQEIDTNIGDNADSIPGKLVTHAWCEATVPPAP